MQPSTAAIDLIVALEDVGEAWYNANAAHPVWPGGDSGVTVGIGYDIGQQTDAVVLRDWLPVLSQPVATMLSRCAGVHGAHAETALRFVRGVTVPWAAAMTVFKTSTLPRYVAQTEAALPNCDKLSGDQFGALVSVGYNRGNGGWAEHDDRHREMLAIHGLMAAEEFSKIPAEIRAMQRLWPHGSALWKRREAEAKLFEGPAA